MRRHPLQPLKLLLKGRLYRFRPHFFLGALTQLTNRLGARVAQVLLDRLYLLLQEILALLLIHRLVRPLADVCFDGKHLVVLLQDRQQRRRAVHEHVDGEQLLLLLDAQVVCRADIIDEGRAVGDGFQGHQQFYRRVLFLVQNPQNEITDRRMNSRKLLVPFQRHSFL